MHIIVTLLGGGCQKNFNWVLCLAAPQLVDQLDACRILIDVRAESRKRCERKKERKKESTTPTPSRNQKQERKRRKGMNSMREKQRLRTCLHICIFA
jgi:hypothetical protein